MADLRGEKSFVVRETLRREGWKAQLSESVTTVDELAGILPVDREALRNVVTRYPMRIPRSFIALIREKNDPLWRQAVPDPAELSEDGDEDPSFECAQSPVPGLVHRYPDRVLWMVSDRCAMYCRFCMRKRLVGRAGAPLPVAEVIDYIRKHRDIREVILSGGDPLLLSDAKLETVLAAIRSVAHVEIIRIHTRTPGALPGRISSELVSLLRRFHPLWLQVHFNHPLELTADARAACAALAEAGIPLGSQTVLLKGVNDDPDVLASLMRELVALRIRPYYLHHGDPVRGAAHFRTSLRAGLSLMRTLRGRVSGLCLPTYMIDLPGGGGKIPLLPEYIEKISDDRLVVRNYQGKRYVYPL